MRNQKHASMSAIQARPGNDERHKVSNITGNKHATVAGSKFQKALIAESLKPALFIDRPNVVAELTKPRSDSLTGDMRIEEQPHGAGGMTAG